MFFYFCPGSYRHALFCAGGVRGRLCFRAREIVSKIPMSNEQTGKMQCFAPVRPRMVHEGVVIR